MGINPATWNNLGSGKTFVQRYRLTFTNLWDGSSEVWEHYGSPYTSRTWLIDRNGNRIGDAAASFSAARFQRLVDDLE